MGLLRDWTTSLINRSPLVEKQYSYLAGVQAWQGGPDAVERHHPQRPDVRQDEAAQDGR